MKPLPPRIAEIVREAAARHRVRPEEVLSADRTRAVAYARFEAIKACRALTPQPSMPQIGRWFGRDHTTVLHALRHVPAEGYRGPPPARRDAEAWAADWGRLL